MRSYLHLRPSPPAPLPRTGEGSALAASAMWATTDLDAEPPAPRQGAATGSPLPRAGEGLGVRADYPIPQHADPLDLQLDHVARPQPAVELEAGAAGNGAGAPELAGIDRLALGDVGDQVGEGKMPTGARPLRPDLTVDAGDHPQ